MLCVSPSLTKAPDDGRRPGSKARGARDRRRAQPRAGEAEHGAHVEDRSFEAGRVSVGIKLGVQRSVGAGRIGCVKGADPATATLIKYFAHGADLRAGFRAGLRDSRRRKWEQQLILSRLALEALRHMRLPATYVDLPGIWPRNVFVQTFGLPIMAELLEAGLVRCGGMPEAGPIVVARESGEAVMASRQVAAFNAARGEPIYPMAADTLLLTYAGWRQKGRLVGRSDRRPRSPRSMSRSAAPSTFSNARSF